MSKPRPLIGQSVSHVGPDSLAGPILLPLTTGSSTTTEQGYPTKYIKLPDETVGQP